MIGTTISNNTSNENGYTKSFDMSVSVAIFRSTFYFYFFSEYVKVPMFTLGHYSFKVVTISGVTGRATRVRHVRWLK